MIRFPMSRRFCGDAGAPFLFALAALMAGTAQAAAPEPESPPPAMRLASSIQDPGVLLGPRDPLQPLPVFVWELRRELCRRKVQCESQCLEDMVRCLQWPLGSSRIEYCEERADVCMESCPRIDC